MADDIKTESSFNSVVDKYKEANEDINSRIRSNYLTMIKYYLKAGDGAVSKYSGAVVTENLINTLIKRFIELGGKYQDIYN